MRSCHFLLALVALATARTDLQGCTSSDVVAYGGASVLWYVPGTGEICSFLDCGGGMAPPMTTVPGCPLYSGTATVTPSFLAGFEDGSAAVSSAAYAAASTTSPSSAMITGSSTTEGPSQITLTGVVSSSSTVPSDSVSTEFVTSTGTASESKSTSSGGTKSSISSASGSSTSSAASSSSTSNAGVTTSVHLLAHVIIGAAAAGFAFLL